MPSSQLINEYADSEAAKPADGWAVFNKERFARYGLLIATGIRSRLDDIIEALEEEAEPRPTGTKRKQKAGRSPRRQNTK